MRRVPTRVVAVLGTLSILGQVSTTTTAVAVVIERLKRLNLPYGTGSVLSEQRLL